MQKSFAILAILCTEFQAALYSSASKNLIESRNLRKSVGLHLASCAEAESRRGNYLYGRSIARNELAQGRWLFPEGVLRIRGGRVKAREKLDEENEKMAGMLLKKLKPHPFFEMMGEENPEKDENTKDSDASDIDFVEAEARRRSAVNSRSLLWGLTQRTAVCIVLPDDLWPKIQTVRMEHDRWTKRWFHPVIVLLHPFFPAELLAEASEAIQTRLRSTPAFTLCMEELRVYTHASSASLRLLPDAATKAALEALHESLIALFPTLAHDGHNRFEGDAAPHLMLGQFPSDREAQAAAAALRAEGWGPVSFRAEELMVMAREEEPDGRDNRATGRAPFECMRAIVLGMGADPVEPGPISEAEANLDGSDEPAAVVQQWDPAAGRFRPVRDGELAELDARARAREEEERRRRAEKMDGLSRSFFREPDRQTEAQRAAIPAAVVANVTAALLRADGPGGDGALLTEFAREYRRRCGASLTRLAGDLGFRGVGQLLRAMPDVVRLTRRRADVFVHRAVPPEERERLRRASAVRKELAAMRRRDATEAAAARGTNRRVRAAEARAMRRFARRVGPADAALVEEYGARLVDRARDARFGPLRTDPDSPHYDPEAARFAAELDAARRADAARRGAGESGSSEAERGGGSSGGGSETWGAGSEDDGPGDGGEGSAGSGSDSRAGREQDSESGRAGQAAADEDGWVGGGGGGRDGGDAEAEADRAAQAEVRQRLLRRGDRKGRRRA